MFVLFPEADGIAKLRKIPSEGEEVTRNQTAVFCAPVLLRAVTFASQHIGAKICESRIFIIAICRFLCAMTRQKCVSRLSENQRSGAGCAHGVVDGDYKHNE